MRQIKIGKVVLTKGGNWNATTGYAILTYVLHNGDGWWSIKANVNSEPSATNTNWIQATDTQALRTAMQSLITSATTLEATIEAAEALRVSSENSRVSAETARTQKEQERVQSETTRNQNEVTRQSNESTRQSQENTRQSKEQQRVTSENNRVSAENARETAATQAISNANAATNTANAAAATAQSASATATAASTLANKAVEDANEVIETMNAKIAVANTDHTRAEGDHSTATTDHSNAATDHTTAGTDHSLAASDHSTAASDHTAASTDHSNATADHTQAASDHSTAASDHETAQSDHTLAVADHTNMGARVTSLEQTKADKNGHYEGMSVAMAENLIGKGNATEQTFTERVAGGGASIEDGVAEYRKIKGNSIAWRQMVSNPHYVGTVRSNTATNVCPVTVQNGHMYLLAAIGNMNSSTTTQTNVTPPQSIRGEGISIFKATSDASDNVFMYNTGESYEADCINILLDLTLTFGSAIADTITTADDVAKLLGYASWDAYAASEQFATDMQYSEVGEIRNFTAKKVVTTGRNLWDEDWEFGMLSASDGSEVAHASEIRSKNYILCEPNTRYYIKSPYRCIVNAYDEKKRFIEWVHYYDCNMEFNKVTPSNARYLRFCTFDNNAISTYNNDISIFKYVQGMSTDYEPYETHELDVDPSTIKDSNGQQLFPYGLCKAGSVYDEITKDGAVKRVGCKVFDGTENINYAEEGKFFIDVLYDRKTESNNGLSTEFIVQRHNFAWGTNETCGFNTYLPDNRPERFYIQTSIYLNLNSLKTHFSELYSAGTPFVVFYELATPISVTFSEERQTDVEVFSGGTEKIVVAEGGKSTPICADVNYSIDYVTTIDKLHEAMPNVQEVKSDVDMSMQAWKILIAEKFGCNSSKVVAIDANNLLWQYRNVWSAEQKYTFDVNIGYLSTEGGKVAMLNYNTKTFSELANMCITSNIGGNNVIVRNDSITNVESFKQSLKGIYLFYEKA